MSGPPILRILDLSWHRWGADQVAGQPAPISSAEFELMCERELACDPLQPFDPSQSRPVF